MQTEKDEMRRQRGYEIAQTSKIEHDNDGWKVPSQSGNGQYTVIIEPLRSSCPCPDCTTRQVKCKHIFAVEHIMTSETDSLGNVKVTHTIRQTYAQEWSSYDQASINQKTAFMKLIKDLTDTVENPEYTFGRPTLPQSDMVYATLMKVYTTFSLRRFMSDMETAREKGYIASKPCYASVGHFMQKPEITPLLSNLVTLTSLPLKDVETAFAVDSTGFGTSNFQRWFSVKHGKEISTKKFIKCHFMCGTKTNVVTSVKITTETGADSPQMPELVQKTGENFDMKEVTADKAYSGRANMEIVNDFGGMPYIPYRSNATGLSRGSPIWKKMYHYFQLNNVQFMEHYHRRSNAETTVHMIKSKFGSFVRSTSWTAQVNELLAKVICHNICVIVQEMHELGIIPQFDNKFIKQEGDE